MVKRSHAVLINVDYASEYHGKVKHPFLLLLPLVMHILSSPHLSHERICNKPSPAVSVVGCSLLLLKIEPIFDFIIPRFPWSSPSSIATHGAMEDGLGKHVMFFSYCSIVICDMFSYKMPRILDNISFTLHLHLFITLL